jgi:predicted transcriptional regulator
VSRKRNTPLPGGELETRVLNALLELGQGTARDLHARVGVALDLAYTTIATVLDRLHHKGLVRRHRDGRAFVYAAAVEKSALDRARARDLVDRFLGDETRPALAALVDAVESIDGELLDELARQVAAKRRPK